MNDFDLEALKEFTGDSQYDHMIIEDEPYGLFEISMDDGKTWAVKWVTPRELISHLHSGHTVQGGG